jgi:protein tyrosine phosphatase
MLENQALVKRTLQITNTETLESKIVFQLHFIAWPDFGVLKTPSAFLTLADHVNHHNNPRGPIVVHCSAGVGRTGTFMLIQIVLEKLKDDIQKAQLSNTSAINENTLHVDIPEILLKMRKLLIKPFLFVS